MCLRSHLGVSDQALLVTVLQLVQMAIGIMITLSGVPGDGATGVFLQKQLPRKGNSSLRSHIHIMIYETVKNCDGHIPNLTAALGMSGTRWSLAVLPWLTRFGLPLGTFHFQTDELTGRSCSSLSRESLLSSCTEVRLLLHPFRPISGAEVPWSPSSSPESSPTRLFHWDHRSENLGACRTRKDTAECGSGDRTSFL